MSSELVQFHHGDTETRRNPPPWFEIRTERKTKTLMSCRGERRDSRLTHNGLPLLSPCLRVSVVKSALRRLHHQPQFLQLLLAHRSRRIYHQIHRARRLREGNDLSQAVRTRQNHDNPVKAQSNPAVRRRAVLQGLQEKPKTAAGLFLRHAQRTENQALNFL